MTKNREVLRVELKPTGIRFVGRKSVVGKGNRIVRVSVYPRLLCVEFKKPSGVVGFVHREYPEDLPPVVYTHGRPEMTAENDLPPHGYYKAVISDGTRSRKMTAHYYDYTAPFNGFAAYRRIALDGYPIGDLLLSFDCEPIVVYREFLWSDEVLETKTPTGVSRSIRGWYSTGKNVVFDDIGSPVPIPLPSD